MIGKKVGITLIILILTTSVIVYLKFFKISEEVKLEEIKKTEVTEETEEGVYSSNIIKDVNYNTKDQDGNEYTISALQGEIDYSNPNILYLTTVRAIIKLKSSEIITITSNYGKYNSANFDTIFSKNVIINYLENKITGEYLDFSLQRNSMIISKDVIYTNIKNILRADVVEIDIKTKDTKIFMHEKKGKVNIKSKDRNGS